MAQYGNWEDDDIVLDTVLNDFFEAVWTPVLPQVAEGDAPASVAVSAVSLPTAAAALPVAAVSAAYIPKPVPTLTPETQHFNELTCSPSACRSAALNSFLLPRLKAQRLSSAAAQAQGCSAAPAAALPSQSCVRQAACPCRRRRSRCHWHTQRRCALAARRQIRHADSARRAPPGCQRRTAPRHTKAHAAQPCGQDGERAFSAHRIGVRAWTEASQRATTPRAKRGSGANARLAASCTHRAAS
jgi:hypothetical protein